GYAARLLKGCMRVEAGPMPPRAGDVSMCSDKLIRFLGAQPFRAWPHVDELFPTHREWHHGDPRGGVERLGRGLYHCPGSSTEDVICREIAIERGVREGVVCVTDE